jgi:hypothetical protein
MDVTAPKSQAAQTLDALKRISAGLTDVGSGGSAEEAEQRRYRTGVRRRRRRGSRRSRRYAEVDRTDRLRAQRRQVNAARILETINGTAGSEIARVSATVAQRAAYRGAGPERRRKRAGGGCGDSAPRRATEEARPSGAL